MNQTGNRPAPGYGVAGTPASTVVAAVNDHGYTKALVTF
jgi:hypothetical protein